jgi:hypothetical protein
MSRPWKRLAAGLALLTVVATMAVMATSSAFAFVIGVDQPSSANGGSPSNAPGSLSRLALRPASSEMFTANYTQLATSATPSSIIKTMYQQWRHDQQNDWFYLYATKVNSNANALSTFAFFYYVPGRGSTMLTSGLADAGAASQILTAATIYLGSSGTTAPAFIVDQVSATAPLCASMVVPCAASFSSTLRWGIAMQGFRVGSMTLLQAVESFPTPTASIASATVYYDAWESPTGVANVVTLNGTAPTQATNGVTNATGTREANLGVPYSMTQTVNDVDGDLLGQSLVWVFASGPNMGQWFQAGVYNMRTNQGSSAAPNTSGTGSQAAATAFYQDWQTAPIFFAVGSGTTAGYFTQLTVGAPSQTLRTFEASPGGIGGIGVVSQSVTYSFIYSATARGTLNIFGNAGDWHGLWSGNVPVGTQTVT